MKDHGIATQSIFVRKKGVGHYKFHYFSGGASYLLPKNIKGGPDDSTFMLIAIPPVKNPKNECSLTHYYVHALMMYFAPAAGRPNW